MKQMSIASHGMSMTLEVGNGIVLESLYDKTIEHEYIIRADPLFVFRIGTEIYDSRYDVEVLSAQEGDGAIGIVAKSRKDDLAFTLTVQPDPDAPALLLNFTVENNTAQPQYVMLEYPKIRTVRLPGEPEDAFASVPQEIGWVGPYDTESTFGFAPSNTINGFAPKDTDTGLSTGQNVMDVLSVYNNKNLGGLFIADISGDITKNRPPVNMVIHKTTLVGYSVAELEPGQKHQSAIVAIGAIRNDDWHAAVDYYTEKHRPDWEFPEVPLWLREAGAVYSAMEGGAGGCYMLLENHMQLDQRIGHFSNLPALLTKAREYGTNVVFVSDYYDKANITGVPINPPELTGAVGSHYWNKGDYIPREDLGGPEAFRDGVAALHEQGGKIIVYVEPYIILNFSNIGREKGDLWAARNPDGSLYEAAPYNYTMCAALDAWREHVIQACITLVRDYDVDGIFLDSMGWQWNHLFMTKADNRTYSLREYNESFLSIAVEVRKAIREIKPDAALLSETGGGPLPRYNDGGWTADLAWGMTVSSPTILAAPVRYGIPEANLFSNGTNLNHTNQYFAAGFGLAVGEYWKNHAEYIKTLTELRLKYKDAMIYGRQEYQPATENPSGVAAYYYAGEQTTVVTVVNTTFYQYAGTVRLEREESGSQWVDELTGTAYTADGDGVINVDMPDMTLLFLRKVS